MKDAHCSLNAAPAPAQKKCIKNYGENVIVNEIFKINQQQHCSSNQMLKSEQKKQSNTKKKLWKIENFLTN